VRSLLVGRANLAIALLTRGRPEDSDEGGRLLQLALEAARRLILPEAQQIEQLVEQAGLGGDHCRAALTMTARLVIARSRRAATQSGRAARN